MPPEVEHVEEWLDSETKRLLATVDMFRDRDLTESSSRPAKAVSTDQRRSDSAPAKSDVMAKYGSTQNAVEMQRRLTTNAGSL